MKENGSEIRWEVDSAKCKGCGDCVIVCPVRALRISRKVAKLTDPESCCRDSCRICEYHCPEGAIRAY
jgi:NAD-dependent dihydropyrimidine dehydrogenase PreA subunit